MASKLSDLTALEESDAEQACGISILILEDRKAPKTALMGALAWVHRRREEPNLTYRDYMKSVKVRDIYGYLFGDDDKEESADPFPEGAGAEAGATPDEVAGPEGAVPPGDGDGDQP